MRKYALSLFGLFTYLTAFPQISLTYQTHALLPDKVNTMQLTNYADPARVEPINFGTLAGCPIQLTLEARLPLRPISKV